MTRFVRLIATALLVTASSFAAAQDFPSKPIRLIVPFAPGGSTDVIARIVAPALGRALGQTVVIENKPGGGGTTGTLEMLRAPADGHTLALATASTVSANPAINPKAPYGPGDLTPIVNLAATPTVIAVHPGFPANDFAGFVSALKSKPGGYSYASSGVGGISHLQMETFKSMTKTFVTHIPYRGAAPALNDTIGGQVQIVMDAFPSALPFIKAGKLRAIVVTAPKRIAGLPDTPTFAEVGLGPMNRMSSFGIIGQKALPADIVRKINAAARTALEDPVVRQRIEESGAGAVGGTSEQYAADINAEYNQLKRVVQEQKLSLDAPN
jgi:tripartite-type tricarboxylate transporter receptor subunit TctC